MRLGEAVDGYGPVEHPWQGGEGGVGDIVGQALVYFVGDDHHLGEV